MTTLRNLASLFDSLPGSTRGILWMIISALCYAGTYATVRVLSDSFGAFQIVFFRSALGILFMLPWLYRAGFGALRTSRYGLYATRTGLNYIGMVCLMFGIANLTLQDVTALMFTVPLFTVLFVALLLGETVGAPRWFALVIGFIGAMVIIRPGFVELSIGTIAVMITSAAYSLVNTANKSLTATEKPDTIVFHGFVLLALIATGPAFYLWVAPQWSHGPWIILLGVLSSAATLFIMRAFAATAASVIMPFNFLKLPFAVVIGMIWFAEHPDLWTMAGAAVIFSSTWYIARREAKRAAAEKADKKSL
ncbi:MAG: DMT family transporter [Alphaproteobacteria bacterium]